MFTVTNMVTVRIFLVMSDKCNVTGDCSSGKVNVNLFLLMEQEEEEEE
jgi:hypothetical protein